MICGRTSDVREDEVVDDAQMLLLLTTAPSATRSSRFSAHDPLRAPAVTLDADMHKRGKELPGVKDRIRTVSCAQKKKPDER